MQSEKNPEHIRQRMHALRNSLANDVQEVATSVRAKSDWRYYLKAHPWLTLGAVTTVGYMLAPRRVQRTERLVPDPEALARLAKEERLVMSPESEVRSTSGGFASKLFALALAAGTRVAVDYFGNKLGSAFDGALDKDIHDEPETSAGFASFNPK